ncbi:DUF485 domain-containing protein [Paraburkholderia sediminicola]|uniref:DUF485 domain-containing protein n=1 Tax=Paraburkholderia sediminicola TaxID=458836 RepID=UPI0038B8B06B
MVHTASAQPGDASPPNAAYVVAVNPILQDPRFQVLVHRRRTFAWSLTATMLIVYFGFILTLAFSPQTLGHPISSSMPSTWGIPVGLGMFVFTFLLVAIYVFRANTAFDAAITEIKQGTQK